MNENTDESKFKKAYRDKVNFKTFSETDSDKYVNSRFSLLRELATEAAPEVNNIKTAASVKELLSFSEVKEYFADFLDFTMHTQHLTPYESGVFFSTFVVMQFWNLFNIRYYETGRSLLADIAGIVARKRRVSDCFSGGFLLIAAVILFGQILIVNLAGDFFEVAPLTAQDWLWTLLATSLVLLVPDLIRTISRLLRRSARPA